MKVNIGTPRDIWFGPYHIAELLKYVGVSEEQRDKVGNILADSWVEDVCVWIYANNPLRHQSVKIKIDPWDTWSMDYTLAPIILPMLIQLNSQKHGSPLVQDSDVPDYLKSMNARRVGDEYGVDELYFERWDYVLSEMIFAFNCIANEQADVIDTMSDEEYESNNDRINNGLRLFGVYFRSLWS